MAIAQRMEPKRKIQIAILINLWLIGYRLWWQFLHLPKKISKKSNKLSTGELSE